MLIDRNDIDLRLVRLGRGLGALRLRIGEGLLRLDERDGLRALGFPNLESYAREALGRSGRWGADARALARRLSCLPMLREALVTGRLSTSMVELVARVATPDDEAAAVERAATMTVRAMRAHLKDAQSDSGDTSEPRATIQTTVDRIDAWAFERTRLMVEAVGARRGDGTIEAMLAEGLTEIIATHDDLDLPRGLTASSIDTSRGFRAELAEARAHQELVAKAQVRRIQNSTGSSSEVGPSKLGPYGSAWCEIAWPGPDIDRAEAIADIDAKLRAIARELAWRDLELGDLARCAEGSGVWRELGYASFAHYCRERVGLAPSAIASRLALARRIVDLPEVEVAIAAGRIGYASAAIVARVASASTVDAWVERAAARTVKHLREEVDAIEMLARAEGRDPRRMGPPDPELLDELHSVERAAIATVTSQMSGGSAVAVSEGDIDVDAAKATLRFTVSESTASFWRSLERLHGQLAPGTSFIGFLVRATMRAWAGSLPTPVRLCAHLPPRSVALRVAGVPLALGNAAPHRLSQPRWIRRALEPGEPVRDVPPRARARWAPRGHGRRRALAVVARRGLEREGLRGPRRATTGLHFVAAGLARPNVARLSRLGRASPAATDDP